MPWYIILFYLFAFLGLVMGVLFFVKRKGDRLANSLLGIYTILFSLELVYNCFKWSGYLLQESFVHFTMMHSLLWLTYGPLVYLYVRQVLKRKGLFKKDLLFLLPTVVIGVLGFPFFGMGAEEKIEILKSGSYYQNTFMPTWGIWPVMLLMFFYGWLTYRRFGPRTNTDFNKNRWLIWFLGSYIGFVAAFFFYVFVVQFELMDYRYDYFVDIVIVFFIAMLSFFGFVQPEVFEGKRIKEVLPFVKYRKTGLSDALSLEMRDKLLHIMQHEKPFLENTLRLDDLATRLNLSRNHTSQIINQHFNLSFFDFLNKYRVEEAKMLLLHSTGEKRTITQIAYDAGFNNRASFYKAFRKFEEQNPTAILNTRQAS